MTSVCGYYLTNLLSSIDYLIPACSSKKSINFLIKRRTKMDTPIAAAIHTIEKIIAINEIEFCLKEHPAKSVKSLNSIAMLRYSTIQGLLKFF